jgi:transposase
MDQVKAHCGLLFGLDASWHVTDVALELKQKRITDSLEFVGSGAVCPECAAKCGLKDHASERQWRHLDTMRFESILTVAMPRSDCDTCDVKTVSVVGR